MSSSHLLDDHSLLQSAEAVENARRRLGGLAGFLDSVARVPGTEIRVGADVLLNLIPGLGMMVSKGFSAYLIFEARRLGVPTATLLRMAGNVGIDLVIGAIPIVGWVGDAFFRANIRNMALLSDHFDGTQPRPSRFASKPRSMFEAAQAPIVESVR